MDNGADCRASDGEDSETHRSWNTDPATSSAASFSLEREIRKQSNTSRLEIDFLSHKKTHLRYGYTQNSLVVILDA
jgi:hypothetical protein